MTRSGRGPRLAWGLAAAGVLIAAVLMARYAGHLHLLVANVPALGTFAPVATATTPYVQAAPSGRYAIVAALIVFGALLAMRGRRRRTRPIP